MQRNNLTFWIKNKRKEKAQHLTFGCNEFRPDIYYGSKKSWIIVTTKTKPQFK